jgi:GTP cyclohydrolase I
VRSDITRNQVDSIEAGIRAMLMSTGRDPDDDSLKRTPARVVKAFLEMTDGYTHDPKHILSVQFETERENDELVMVRGVDFVSLCEHHLLPFIGTAAVGYIPGKDSGVVGLSKLARLVDCYSRRLQLQERMTEQIAQALQKHLEPIGVAVLVEATHNCMACRGVKKANAVMVTSAMLGAFREKPEARDEFLSLAR